MINPVEHIEHTMKLLMKASSFELREALGTAVEIDPLHTLTVRELIAKELISISFNPHATKDCRTRALRCAKLYLKDSAGEA